MPQTYKTVPIVFTNKGLVARYAEDRVPDPSVYLNLANAECRQENALSSRFGVQSITNNGIGSVPLPAPVHSLGRLKSLNNIVHRLAGAGTKVYQRTGNANGAYTDISGAFTLSGDPWTEVVSSPPLSAYPYAYIFDEGVNVKYVDGLSAVLMTGIFAPLIIPTIVLAVGVSQIDVIDLYINIGGTNPVLTSGLTAVTNPTVYSTTLSADIAAPGYQGATVAAATNILPGRLLFTTTESPEVGQVVSNVVYAFFQRIYVAGTPFSDYYLSASIAASTSAWAGRSMGTPDAAEPADLSTIGGIEMATTDVFNLAFYVDNPGNISGLSLAFAVGPNIQTLGSFTDYYSGAFATSASTPSLTTPTGVTLSSVTGIGILVPIQTYGYRVSAANATGETLASVETTITPKTVYGYCSIKISWSAVAGATYYKIYGRTPGGEQFIDSVPAALTTYTDMGNLPPNGPLPGTNTTTFGAGWNFLTISRAAFNPIGKAGHPGYTWANVQAYQINVETNSGGGASVGFGDFFVSVGSQLDVTGGIPYDYRFTYYNANTGVESNPSADMLGVNLVSPVNQSVSILFSDTPTSPEITHRRLYRLGGSLSEAWYQIAQLPITQTAYLDSWPDSQIVNNNQLQLDNDPPVTSTLQVSISVTLQTATAVNSLLTVSFTPNANIVANQQVTIDAGLSSEETVYVIQGGTSSFKAFFQNIHEPGAMITVSTYPAYGVNIACLAFDIVWAAGDSNNPSTLYYSKTGNPEAWPPENTLVVGPPSDPITGIIFFRGQLYVFTLSTIYQIIAAQTSTPFPIITASLHGLVSNFGIAQVEGEMIYQGIDGCYAFAGGGSGLLSEIIDWIERGITSNQSSGNTGKLRPKSTIFQARRPFEPHPVVPMDQSNLDTVKAAFCDNEAFFSYTGTDGNLHRIIYSTIYKRWRNDDVPALSMYYEQDTGYLIVGEANGNIYQDRVGDFDDGGWSGGVETETPIVINVQSQLLDFGNQKAEKIFNEVSLDIDTAGQDLILNFYYDNLGTIGDTFTVNTASRQQVQLNLNGGAGWRARRLSFQITGAVTTVVTLYQFDIRMALEAENRQSWDSYQMTFDNGEFHIAKQGYFVYEAPNGPITVNVYLEGAEDPSYSFTLPQTGPTTDSGTNTLSRSSLKVRFPAFKSKVWRFTGTCSGDFKLLAESFIETKPITSEKGYSRHALVEASQT